VVGVNVDGARASPTLTTPEARLTVLEKLLLAAGKGNK